ncbi:hypothetical protein B0H14DRAFT_2649825 [Mycena olivaceomarginata]|nr:hypothetical protein B0H14DRAFT_2649825 [Mycena olivaceomarginata]
MLVLYKEFLDGCRGDLEEEFRIVGQQLHEISWVNPFPLGDLRRAALDTKRTFLPLKFLCFSNTLCYVFSSTLEDATVTLTYLNSDYCKPLSVQCHRKYLKHKLLVIKLAAMQAATEVEARQQETRWVVLACCAGSYLLSGMNDWHLEKLGRRVKLEQNCLVRTIWEKLGRGNETWDMGRPRKNMMGHPTLCDKLRGWDRPWVLETRWDVPCLFTKGRGTSHANSVTGMGCPKTLLSATRAQPCCAEYHPQPERNCAARNTARNPSATVLHGIAVRNPSATVLRGIAVRNPSATVLHGIAVRNPSTTVLHGIPPATRAQLCRTEYHPQPEYKPCCAEYRLQPERNRAARNSHLQPEHNRAAQNSCPQPRQPAFCWQIL